MNLKRPVAILAVAGGMLCGGATPATASSDYPPSGAVMVVTGELVTGGTVQATVHNCIFGETVRTTLDSMPTVVSTCVAVLAGFAAPASASVPGVSRFDLALPATPGAVAGEVDLVDSGQTLSFFLDVRDPELAVVAIDTSAGGFPGWPFLLIAGLLALVAMVLVSKRRVAHATP